MKIWCMSAKYTQYLRHYICYCEKNPVDLIYSEEYEDLYAEVMEELWESFSYLFEENLTDEDTEDWTDDDWDDFYNEQYNNFCDHISFEAYETDEDEAKRFEVLIDHRED